MDVSHRDEHKARVRQQFGSHAQAYVESPKHRSGRDLERLVELAECRPTDEALDIATAAGHTALALSPHVRSVVASDITEEMLAAARRFTGEQGATNLTFELADAEHLPYPNASFDIVSCRIAPHHFSDVAAFCCEVGRVLRPGGRFLLMDSVTPEDDELDTFINRVEKWRDDTHVRSYRFAEWSDWIRDAGLTIDLVEPIIRRHEFPSWTRRSDMEPAQRDALERFIIDAPQRAREYYDVKVVDGRLESFADVKFLLRARKT